MIFLYTEKQRAFQTVINNYFRRIKTMKKAISLALAVCLIVLVFCLGTGAASAEWDTTVAPEITEEVQALFGKALDGLVGVNYTPIAVLGRQENDLCILCKATVVYPGAKPYYALVDISSVDGSAELLNIRVLSIEETDEPEIDYGTSEIYSFEDMDEAVELILNEFSTWSGCEMHSIRYISDECCSAENLAWMNSLRDEKNFTQSIAFESDFHSPVEAYGAWEADTEYTNWQWWLAREEGGSWELITWGY